MANVLHGAAAFQAGRNPAADPPHDDLRSEAAFAMMAMDTPAIPAACLSALSRADGAGSSGALLADMGRALKASFRKPAAFAKIG